MWSNGTRFGQLRLGAYFLFRGGVFKKTGTKLFQNAKLVDARYYKAPMWPIYDPTGHTSIAPWSYVQELVTVRAS